MRRRQGRTGGEVKVEGRLGSERRDEETHEAGGEVKGKSFKSLII